MSVVIRHKSFVLVYIFHASMQSMLVFFFASFTNLKVRISSAIYTTPAR